MNLDKIGGFPNTMGFDLIKFHMQIIGICAWVDSETRGIGYDISRVGWTYIDRRISTKKSIQPLALKFRMMFLGHNIRSGWNLIGFYHQTTRLSSFSTAAIKLGFHRLFLYTTKIWINLIPKQFLNMPKTIELQVDNY